MSIYKTLTSLFQKTDRKTVLHPDFKGKVEKIFTWKGKKYYRFKPEGYGELDMPIGRYYYASVVYKELEHQFDFTQLKDWLRVILGNLNDGDITSASIKIHEIIKRTELLFDPNIVFKLASVMIMDDTEDVNSYDISYNRKKIKDFEEKGLAFFLSRPVSEYLSLKNISKQDITRYLKEAEKIQKEISKMEKVMNLSITTKV